MLGILSHKKQAGRPDARADGPQQRLGLLVDFLAHEVGESAFLRLLDVPVHQDSVF
jgi:hypothetical protein